MNNALILSTGIGNVIFAVRFLDFFLCNLDITYACNNKILLHTIAFILSVPFSFISNIGFFVGTTVVATIVIVTAGLSVSAYFIMFAVNNGIAENQNTFNLGQFGEFFGVVCFAIEGMGLLFPIRASFIDRPRFKRVYTTVFIATSSFYLLLGSTGAYAYGKTAQDVVLLNFGYKYYVIYPQSLLYSIGIFVSLPYILFPLSNSVAQMPIMKKHFEVTLLTNNRKDLIGREFSLESHSCCYALVLVSLEYLFLTS